MKKGNVVVLFLSTFLCAIAFFQVQEVRAFDSFVECDSTFSNHRNVCSGVYRLCRYVWDEQYCSQLFDSCYSGAPGTYASCISSAVSDWRASVMADEPDSYTCWLTCTAKCQQVDPYNACVSELSQIPEDDRPPNFNPADYCGVSPGQCESACNSACNPN